MAFDRGQGLVDILGSAFPLVRNPVIFAAKYSLAAAMAIESAQRDGLVPYDVAVSRLATGYCIGWLVRPATKCRSVGEPEVAVHPQ